MSDREILDWLDANARAHVNLEGQFVLLAHIPGKPQTYTKFNGEGIRRAVEAAVRLQKKSIVLP